MDIAVGPTSAGFSSQAGLAALRAGTVLEQCADCPAELGVPDEAWTVRHLSDGTHEAVPGHSA